MNVYSDINEELHIGVHSDDDEPIIALLQDLFGYEFELSDTKMKIEEHGDFYKDTVVVTSNHINDDLFVALIEQGINIFIVALNG